MERKEAIKLGLPRYITGRPCKHGHISERYTITACCAACIRMYGDQARQSARKAIEARQTAVLD